MATTTDLHGCLPKERPSALLAALTGRVGSLEGQPRDPGAPASLPGKDLAHLVVEVLDVATHDLLGTVGSLLLMASTSSRCFSTAEGRKPSCGSARHHNRCDRPKSRSSESAR